MSDSAEQKTTVHAMTNTVALKLQSNHGILKFKESAIGPALKAYQRHFALSDEHFRDLIKSGGLSAVEPGKDGKRYGQAELARMVAADGGGNDAAKTA